MNLRRIAAIAGLVSALIFLLTIIITFAAGAPPGLDDSAGEVATYYEDNQGLFQLSSVITFVGFFTVPLWFIPIYRWIRDRAWISGEATRPAAADEAGTWATIAFGSFLVTGAIASVQTGITAALVQSIEDTRGSQEVVTALFDSINSLAAGVGAAFALFLIALAMAARGTDYLPSWASPVLLIAGLLSIISIFAPITEVDVLALAGLLAFALFIIIIGSSSIRLLSPRPEADRATAT
jgi:hypothetical protein